MYAELTDAKAISDASQSGSTEALRNARVGRVRGFNTFEHNCLDDDETIFYNRDAVSLAIRAPYPPEGTAFSAMQSEGGFAMTWIKDYGSSILKNRSVFPTYAGAQVIKVKRLAKDGATSLITPAIRVKTSIVPA
ncbi:hypothetical protein ACTOB_006869 [Actinoplanes oblitus]|uniref:Uncharacterized protein n=1 Tax=Actinoplanes oblitus TaxID=3040509 RepID=A0ABY8WGG8_9ACTN|nr:hypothetical protein [Actinoplanes oblitus]WIM94815.1 hypothetical protein ACTOB_006869 [Actinoplanes oblitus]